MLSHCDEMSESTQITQKSKPWQTSERKYWRSSKGGRQCRVHIPEKDEGRVHRSCGKSAYHIFELLRKTWDDYLTALTQKLYRNTFCENAFYLLYSFNPDEKSTKGAEQNVVTKSAVSSWIIVKDALTGNGTPVDNFWWISNRICILY